MIYETKANKNQILSGMHRRSTPAFNALYDRLAHAYSAGEEITISVE